MKLFLGSDKPMDVMAQKFGIGPVSRGSHICWCLAECTHTHCRCLNACTPELLLSHGLRLLDCRCLLTPCMCLMVCTPSLQVLLCVHSHTACGYVWVGLGVYGVSVGVYGCLWLFMVVCGDLCVSSPVISPLS